MPLELDEIVLGGEKFISARKAATLVGYTQDYVGQLCRASKINAQRIGRNWYVNETGLIQHKQAYSQGDSLSIFKKEDVFKKTSLKKKSIFKDKLLIYSPDERPLFPVLSSEVPTALPSEFKKTDKGGVQQAKSLKKLTIINSQSLSRERKRIFSEIFHILRPLFFTTIGNAALFATSFFIVFSLISIDYSPIARLLTESKGISYSTQTGAVGGMEWIKPIEHSAQAFYRIVDNTLYYIYETTIERK